MRRVAVDPILALAAAGLLLVALGAGLAWPPLAPVTLGAGLLVYAVFLQPDNRETPK